MNESGQGNGYETLSLNILLAEDNPDNQALAKAILTKLGCKIEIANNGTEAVEASQKNQFDLILMDCRMPIMDGFEATREIRRAEKRAADNAHIPIIALTANATSDYYQQCIDVGMDAYLAKPYRIDDLLSILKQWGGKQ